MKSFCLPSMLLSVALVMFIGCLSNTGSIGRLDDIEVREHHFDDVPIGEILDNMLKELNAQLAERELPGLSMTAELEVKHECENSSTNIPTSLMDQRVSFSLGCMTARKFVIEIANNCGFCVSFVPGRIMLKQKSCSGDGYHHGK